MTAFLDDMRIPAIFSLLLHLTALVYFTFGNPWTGPRDLIVPPPPVVEIITIGKVTETTKISSANRLLEKDEPPPPDEKPGKPAMAPVNTSSEAVIPPALVERPPEARAPAPPAETPRPKATPRPPKPRPAPPVTAQKQTDTAQAFDSVLKNLVGGSGAPQAEKTVKADSGEAEGYQAPLGERMSISEQDALRAQLERCWHVPIGARDAENLVVAVRLVVNPDRTVREARIVDQSRYNRDSFFRAAADSALRAVRNPKCSPLAVPPDKYEQWRVVTVTFDPKGMF